MSERSSELEAVARVSFLAPELLVAAIRLDPEDEVDRPWEVVLESAEEAVEVDARWLAYVPTEGDPAAQERLLTLRLPAGAPQSALGRLVLRYGEHMRRLSPESVSEVACEPAELAAGLGELSEADGERIPHFLAAAPGAHGLELNEAVSGRLMAIREVLRPRLPASRLKPEIRSAAALEAITMIDERAFWIVGWIRDPHPRRARLTFVSPEGARVEPQEGAVSFRRRADLEKAFGGADDGPAPALNRGFAAYVELDCASRRSEGWILELRGASETVEAPARQPVVDNPDQLRSAAMQPLRVPRPDYDIVANQVFPTLTRLRQRTEEDIRVEYVADYGPQLESPDVSIVIAVGSRPDLVEHQIVQFAHDPEVRAAEVVYVVGSAAAADLARIATQLAALYRISVRVVTLTGGGTLAGATTAGVASARGHLLVLLGGDVFPDRPGWLGRMRERHQATARVGVVGAKLLHEDGSIQHAGFAADRREEAPYWALRSPFKGLGRSLPAANRPQEVYATASECLMVAADAYERHGGLAGRFLENADEGADLCLRLAEAGLSTFYEPAAELYCLENQAWPAQNAPATQRYNEWLFDAMWGRHLSEVEGSPAAASTQRTPVAVPSISSEARFGIRRPGAAVEILEVESADQQGGLLLEAGLDRPRPGSEVDPYDSTYSFAVEGWALARDGAPLTVEILTESQPLREVAADIHRADLAERHPDQPGADAGGFTTVVGTLALPERFDVRVDAVAEDGGRTSLATVRGRRRRLRSGFDSTLQPLLVTTLGRTGSSWLALLLSCHPGVVAYRPFQYEARVVSYWMEVLRTLAEPASYIQSILPELYQGHWWIGDERPSPLPLHLQGNNRMPQWLGRESVEVMAGFCQSRIEDFYREVARAEGVDAPRYYAEKCWPEHFTPRIVAELYPEGREIMLVRDFRDMVCSILGFNAKRGFASFGRESADSDDEFIRELRVSANRMLESWQDRSETAHLVRYEDLILDAEPTLTGMFEYLDLDSDPATIRRLIEEAESVNREGQADHKTSSSVAASVGRWSRELSPELIEVCEESFGDILSAFGYEAASDASPVEQAEVN
jgi:GT2 family glycosyltransferase